MIHFAKGAEVCLSAYKETRAHKRVVGAVAFTVGVTAKQPIGRLVHEMRESWRRSIAAAKGIKWRRKIQTGKTSEQNLLLVLPLWHSLLCLASQCCPNGAERTFPNGVRAAGRAEFTFSPAEVSSQEPFCCSCLSNTFPCCKCILMWRQKASMVWLI